MSQRRYPKYQFHVLPFSQSAVKRYDEPHGSLAAAVVTNDSPYTRLSSSGGGNPPGFEQGEDNQYRITQFLLEYAWQKQGWSIQGEAHYKDIDDRKSGENTELFGAYLQAGLFPSSLADNWPEPLEFAVRAAFVDPGRGQGDDNTELALAANWFFNGHRNKLTADIGRYEIDNEITGMTESENRLRVQYDISF